MPSEGHQPDDTPVPASKPEGSTVGGAPLPPSVSSALESGDGTLGERLRHIAEFSPPRPRYTLLGEIAAGGMGRVLRVWDEVLQRELAMKVVTGAPREGSSAEERSDHGRQVGRFIEEARITGQLDHPGIVPVHEIAVDDDENVYFTMPLVRGHTLKHAFELVRENRDGWTLHRALDVLHKVCMTVAFAHSRGVIHRDLKPENIMVGPFGETYTMDWGLALIEGRRENGAVVGTPAYMAPEQAHHVDEVGPRSDVYSLGAILYELLGDGVPHQKTIAERTTRTTIDSLIESPPRKIGEIAPSAPPELIAICDKAMAAEPMNRYDSARELARDLQAWLEGRVVQAHETGTLAHLRKWRGRNRPLFFSLEAIVALSLLSAVVLVVQQRDRIQTVEAKNRKINEESYSANLHAANLHLRVRELKDARKRLAACAEDLRGWEWDHLELYANASSSVLDHEQEVRTVAVSDDGTRIATASDDGSVRLWNEHGELAHVLRGHTDIVDALRFQPNTLRLASGSGDRTIRFWNASDGSLELVIQFDARVQSLAFSADGSRFASGSFEGTVLVRMTHDVEAVEIRLDASSGPVSALAFAPDGAHILTGDVSGKIARWDLNTGTRVREELIAGRAIESIVFGPSGNGEDTGEAILVATADNQVLQLHPTQLVMTRAFVGHDAVVTSIAIDATGERMLTAAMDYTARMWDLRSGASTATFVGHTAVVNAVAFLPGGSRFVSGSEDGTARIWSPGTEAVVALEHGAAWVTSLAFAPDSERLVSASHDGGLRVWNTRNGDLIEAVRTPDSVYCVAWAPDDRVVFGGWDDSLRVLEPGTDAPWEVLSATGRYPVSIDVDNASGRILARYAGHGVHVWNPGERQPALSLGGLDESPAATFHPNGETFATASLDGSVTLRYTADGRERLALSGSSAPITAIAYSTDGELLAAGTRDRSILIWSTATGELQRTLRGHENQITSLAFSPDDARLISGSVDRTVRLWNPRSGEALLTLREHTAGIMAVAFSPDGSQIASASKDATVRLWRTNASMLAR